MQLEQLVYVSRASAPVHRVMEVSDILEQSIRNNAANDITGALAFTDTRFVQILEGSHGSIDVLLLKLMIDPRHFDVLVIDRVTVRARTFGDWTMVAPPLTDEAREALELLLANNERAIQPYAALMLRMAQDQQAREASRGAPQ